MEIEFIKEWFFGLSENYNVNPFIFGGIYIGAIPFFTLGVAWLVKNIRKKRSIALPALFTGLCFTSAYIYLIIVGDNVPVWVYGFIGAMVLFGVWSTHKKVQQKLDTKTQESENL